MVTQPVLRVAVAMNNIGVSLLEKRCYHHAQEIFKDAVTLTDSLFGDSSDEIRNVEYAMTKYKQSEKIYANCQSNNQVESNKARAIEIQVVSNNNRSEHIRAILGEHSSSLNSANNHTLFPMRIEFIDIFEDYRTEKKQYTLCLLMVLHNYGISRFCVACASGLFEASNHGVWSPSVSTEDSIASVKSYMNSILLFRMALDSYRNQLSQKDISGADYCEHLHDILFVLNSLTVAYTCANKRSEANVYWSMIDQVGKRIGDHKCSTRNISSLPNAAAVA